MGASREDVFIVIIIYISYVYMTKALAIMLLKAQGFAQGLVKPPNQKYLSDLSKNPPAQKIFALYFAWCSN